MGLGRCELLRLHVTAMLRVATLALVTFIAVGASWQLAAAAAGETTVRSIVALRAVPAARGGLGSAADASDSQVARMTLSGAALILGGGVPVSVVDSGTVRHLRVPRGSSVADVIDLAGVTLGPLDQVLPADGTSAVDAGAVVKVLRVAEASAVVQEPIPFTVQTVADSSMPYGRVVVARAGAEGVAQNTYTVVTVDGEVTSRTLVASVQLAAPTPEVRRVGTVPAAAPGDIQSIITAAAARWGADPNQLLRVAYCESHYNSNAYNASSGASGLFQFLASTWAANSVRAGYGGASVFDPVANANTAAMMFANQQAGQWACK